MVVILLRLLLTRSWFDWLTTNGVIPFALNPSKGGWGDRTCFCARLGLERGKEEAKVEVIRNGDVERQDARGMISRKE